MKLVKNMILIVLGLCILALSEQIKAISFFGPSNFVECTDKYQPKAENDYAGVTIGVACRMKFKEKRRINTAECFLKNVTHTKSVIATKAIVRACVNIHDDKKNIRWSRCILKKLPGMKIDGAANSIARACHE